MRTIFWKTQQWAQKNLLNLLLAICGVSLALALLSNRGSSAKALEGTPAPAFALASMDGQQFQLQNHLGKDVVVLDFFATWCGPCRVALPHINSLYEKHEDNGVIVRAVNVGEDTETVESMWKDEKFSLPVVLDPGGEAADVYGVQGIPQTVVIGKDGLVKLVMVGAGGDSDEQLDKAIEAALKQQ